MAPAEPAHLQLPARPPAPNHALGFAILSLAPTLPVSSMQSEAATAGHKDSLPVSVTDGPGAALSLLPVPSASCDSRRCPARSPRPWARSGER